jgi:hypothetical protein
MKYTDFEFYDEETGEVFLVEVQDTQYAQREALQIAHENFDTPRLIRQIPEWEANILGYDTY